MYCAVQGGSGAGRIIVTLGSNLLFPSYRGYPNDPSLPKPYLDADAYVESLRPSAGASSQRMVPMLDSLGRLGGCRANRHYQPQHETGEQDDEHPNYDLL